MTKGAQKNMAFPPAYGLVALMVLGLDLLTKQLARGLTSPVTLIPGFVGLRYAENTGMAFSLLSGQTWLLGLASLVCIAAGWLILRRYRLGSLSRIAAMLMLGGALGNALDRLLRGYVIDMVELLFIDFAIFNLADAALTVGCLLMGYSLLRHPDEWALRAPGIPSNTEESRHMP